MIRPLPRFIEVSPASGGPPLCVNMNHIVAIVHRDEFARFIMIPGVVVFDTSDLYEDVCNAIGRDDGR